MRAIKASFGAALAFALSIPGCGLLLGINNDFRPQCGEGAPACDDKNPCTQDACGADGLCVFTPTDGAPCVGEAGPGACVGGACEPPCGDEPPGCDDDNACTEDTCDTISSKCVHEGSKLAGAPCGPMGQLQCDGMGHCAQCVAASECGVDDECNTYTCTASICDHAVTPAGKAVAAQTGGDCQVNQCDGKGGVASVADDADLPDDGNDCTIDLCSGGAPTAMNSDFGLACVSPSGDGLCDGLGACKKAVGAVCADSIECAMGNCVDGYCCDGPCAEVCKSCGKSGSFGVCSFISKNGKDGYPANACSGLMACDGAGVCKQARGTLCSTASECADGFCTDGRCCNAGCGSACKSCALAGAEGTCSNIPQLAEDNYPVNSCAAPKACDGAGVCKKANGQMCALATDCASGTCANGLCQ